MQNKVPALSSVLSLLTLHYHPLEEMLTTSPEDKHHLL